MTDLLGLLAFLAICGASWWWLRDRPAHDEGHQPVPVVIRNEHTKLLVNNLDRASTACFTVGVATPVAGYMYNISSLRDSLPTDVMVFGGMAWLAAAGGLHFLARRALGGLQ